MAFMVPLMKNHYGIYNIKSALPDHDSGYLLSTSSNLNSGIRRRSGNCQKQSAAGGTVVLNGIVLMNNTSNSRTKSKLKVILTSQNKHQQQQKLRCEKSRSATIKKPCSPTYSSTQSMNTRSFPHVRRTVRNPITNRVYSYSVSIPEYVAEEDEEELAQGGEQQEADQVMIFSTSAPAGTGSIDNGIIDIVDEEEFVRCTGSRLPPTIANQSKKLLLSSKSSGQNGCNTLSSLNPSSSLPNNENAESLSLTSLPQSSLSQSVHSASSNSREYVELLQKFILHLKMLKLKKIFHSNKNSSSTKHKRTRTSTLGDSNNL